MVGKVKFTVTHHEFYDIQLMHVYLQIDLLSVIYYYFIRITI